MRAASRGAASSALARQRHSGCLGLPLLLALTSAWGCGSEPNEESAAVPAQDGGNNTPAAGKSGRKPSGPEEPGAGGAGGVRGAGGAQPECTSDADCALGHACVSSACSASACSPGESRCADGRTAVAVCLPEGHWEASPCAPESTCAERDAGGALCLPWVCSPSVALCAEDGSTLLTCRDDGLAFDASVDCTQAGARCEQGACTGTQCSPEKVQCVGGNVMRCNATGTKLELESACGAHAQYCDPATAACAPHACAPGGAQCDGDWARPCLADGSGVDVTQGTDCAAAGHVCSAGACEAVVCDPAVPVFCEGDTVYDCQKLGTQKSLRLTCDPRQYCDAGRCVRDQCNPGDAMCDDEHTGVCAADGSGVDTSAGTDCASLTDQACFGGACLPVVCTPPDSFECVGQELYRCLDNGTRNYLSRTCAASQVCNAAKGQCESTVCSPGAPACDGNVATTCSGDGLGYVGDRTDCGLAGVCISGVCEPIICEPSEYFCAGGDVMSCSTDGTAASLKDACNAATEHCKPGTSSCQADVCTPGSAVCDGPLESVCAADGSGPAPGGTLCAAGYACEAGTCAPIICQPAVKYCDGEEARQCSDSGTSSTLVATCDGLKHCDTNEHSQANCYDDVCSAGSPACNGETVATCDSDGGGYVSPGVDCSPTSELCTGSGCASEVVIEVGGTTTAIRNYNTRDLYVNKYFAQSDRVLTQIEDYKDSGNGPTITWIVYESDREWGSYKRIHSNHTPSPNLKAEYHSSGAISVPVVAGKFYLIGSAMNGYSTVYHAASVARAYHPGMISIEGLEQEDGIYDPYRSSGNNRVGTFKQRLTFR